MTSWLTHIITRQLSSEHSPKRELALARRKVALAVTVGSSSSKPPLRLNFNRWTFGLVIIVGLAVIGLASITVYNWLDGQAGRRRGDNISFQNSSGTREQEQEKLIKLGEDRLLELQRENTARKKDVDDLEKRLAELAGNIKSLQQLAKEIEQRMGGGGSGNPPTTPSGSTQGGIGGANPARFGPTLDPNAGRSYTTQFSQVVSDLDSLNKTILQGRQNISALDVQVQSYMSTFSQQKKQLDTEMSRLGPGATADGNNPPTTLPVNGPITSPFGIRWSPFVAGVRQMHYGVDIGVWEGTPVAATKAGIVTYTGYDPGYGNRVEISHPGGWLTLYAHNNRILVKVGQTVNKGDIISLSGNTGASTGPHVHYELHDKGVPIDPLKLLSVPVIYQT